MTVGWNFAMFNWKLLHTQYRRIQLLVILWNSAAAIVLYWYLGELMDNLVFSWLSLKDYCWLIPVLKPNCYKHYSHCNTSINDIFELKRTVESVFSEKSSKWGLSFSKKLGLGLVPDCLGCLKNSSFWVSKFYFGIVMGLIEGNIFVSAIH